MAKKTSSDICPEPVCPKEKEFAQFETQLDAQKSTSEKIEAAISRLVENHEKDKKEHMDQFVSITNEIAKIGVTLNQSVETSKQLIANQTSLLEKINEVISSNKVTDANIATINAQLTSHTSEATAWKTDFEKRLIKLETDKAAKVAVAGFIMGTLSAIAIIVEIIGKFI